MRDMITLKDVLEVENDEEILRFRCPETGYLLWPFIRNTFIRFIKSDFHYKTPLIFEEPSLRPRKAYVSVLRACFHNMRKGRHLKGPILISSSGSHVLRDGRYFNRLSDDFALAAKDRTVTLEMLFRDWHWPFPRHNGKVLFDTPLLVSSVLCRRFCLREKHVRTAEGLVKFAAQQAYRTLDWRLSEKREKFLIDTLSKRIASLPMAKSWYTRLFQRTEAKLLIRQLACYGGDSSVMNVIARKFDIITVEYQHGAISSGHDAYNFAEVLRSSEEYKKTLPQYFLGYGKWWTDQINAPVKKITIGNPHRTELLHNVFASKQEKKDLLVLGDGIETEKYLSVCSALAEQTNVELRIVFRPHPQERERVLEKHGKSISSFVVEWEKGIYEAFQTADVVVSELSTGLFEALGLVNRIFLWDTPKARFAYPDGHPFATFFDADELVEKILDGESGRLTSSTVERFWASNWKINYLRFLQEACPGILDPLVL